jgi:hypothetical protein
MDKQRQKFTMLLMAVLPVMSWQSSAMAQA